MNLMGSFTIYLPPELLPWFPTLQFPVLVQCPWTHSLLRDPSQIWPGPLQAGVSLTGLHLILAGFAKCVRSGHCLHSWKRSGKPEDALQEDEAGGATFRAAAPWKQPPPRGMEKA